MRVFWCFVNQTYFVIFRQSYFINQNYSTVTDLAKLRG